MIAQNDAEIGDVQALGAQAPLACPECGGSLWQIDEAGPRFRCHVSHAYSLHTLASEQAARVQAALWAAVRNLRQSIGLAQRMAGAARARGLERSAQYQEELARSFQAHAETLRRLLADATRKAETGSDE